MSRLDSRGGGRKMVETTIGLAKIFLKKNVCNDL